MTRDAAQAFVPALFVVALASTATAQSADTLRLADLQRRAEQSDPRAALVALQQRQYALRQRTIARELLPNVSGTATGQYLSDVPHIALPGAAGPAGPLNHQYDAYVSLRQPVLDPTRAARSAVERAKLDEASASLRSALFAQRQAVSDAYFAVLYQQAQRAALALAITDLAERKRVATVRVTNGAALGSDVWQLDAELLRKQQSLEEAQASEAAARDVLASLTGQPVSRTAVLSLPALTDTTPLPAPGRDRPEFAQLARSRDVLATREALTLAQRKPRLSLVGRTGYGRPGINALGRDFDHYYVAGVQVDWAPWNWGASSREREELTLSAEIVRTNEAQFAAALDRATRADAERVQALQRALADDDTIVSLRERVLQEMRQRFAEGDVTAADYIARLTDWQQAQLDRDTRRIRLAEARARYLTTIGQEPRP